MEGFEQALAVKFGFVLPHLDERQRRLLLGAEARMLGHGGIRLVARVAGVDVEMVSRGAGEVDAGVLPTGRVRGRGAGRKRLADADAGLRPALLALVEPGQRGDPMSPLRWTTKSTRNLAALLSAAGHRVSADVVADLLYEEGFSLQGNAKTLEGAQRPDRDAQFRYINAQAQAYLGDGEPVISVDTKKKEQVGNFKNAGRAWEPKGRAVRVSDHDFLDPKLGRVAPYGIYDVAGNSGWVNVGTDHDTAAFAVESIRRWWNGQGRVDYPRATRLLITADAGGSNGYRTRAFKTGLAILAADTGLAITVCHFPPGTSKWNKIEHRLFSHISMNWRGRPLTSHEVIVQSINATTTRTGLRVHAELDTDTYPTGVRISDRQLAALPLDRHTWHGNWNYTLRPEPFTLINDAPDPFDQPSPDLAWLRHPTLTGIEPTHWDSLMHTLATLHEQQRETTLDKRRGHRPRAVAPGGGRRPTLTLADRLLAEILHQRHGLSHTAIAKLYSVGPETIKRRIHEVRDLLTTAHFTIPHTEHRLITLNGLHRYAHETGLTTPIEINHDS
jgi:hypothetical protein